MTLPIALLLALAAPDPGESGAATPPLSKSNFAMLIRDGDYPEAALAAGEQGVVNFEIDVGTNGRVAACRVTVSSGSAALDEATCRIIKQRARFRPGRDAQGNAVAGTVKSRLGWRM